MVGNYITTETRREAAVRGAVVIFYTGRIALSRPVLTRPRRAWQGNRLSVGVILGGKGGLCKNRKRLTDDGFGSPNVSEIELHSVLKDEWPNVLKWLKNFDLLRCAGLEKLTLHS